ncbi:MAG: class I SAM-dependent methyltransferase [Candidatus Krumholzibacteriia bacterium]
MPDQSCPNCADAPTRRVFSLPPDNDVVQCTGCRLQFARSYPDIATADEAIYSYPYFKTAIDNRAGRERIFAELLAEIEAVAGRMGRLLDVGAGEGTLLLAAGARGWRAEGTDISSAMVAHMRDRLGLTAHHGVLEGIALPERSFDAVVLNHVLEHVQNPRTTLEAVARLLADGGVARVEVPNLSSLSSRSKTLQSRLGLKRNRWRHYDTAHHFWYFTPETLAGTMRAAGLRVVRMSAPARQWGEKTMFDRIANRIYARPLLGGHLVAYAACR